MPETMRRKEQLQALPLRRGRKTMLPYESGKNDQNTSSEENRR